MSLTYEILKRAVKLSGLKKSMEMDSSEIIEVMNRRNAKNRIPDLKDQDFDIERILCDGYPVVVMKHKEKTEKACLFLIGGGMVKWPNPASLKKALRIAKETGLDLYVPYYPLCTKNPVSRSFAMIAETYRTMLEEYDSSNITLFGTSSGGCLALGLIAYLNAMHMDLARPAQILAISPGTCPVSKEEKQRMAELYEKDVIIPAKYMITAEEIMKHGTKVPGYMLHLQEGDFTDCPRVTFMYGSDEVLYAIAPSFEKTMQKYGVNYRMIIGEGMFHCYPVFPVCPEAKAGWDQMIRILKGEEV